jgi:flagellar hook assembly protein FlgD
LLGEKVRTLVKQRQPAGYYEVKWDGRDRFGNTAGSGIFFYQIQAAEYVKSRKMVLLR